MWTPSHTKEMYGNVIPTRTLVMWQVQYAETIGLYLGVYG